MAMRRMNEMWRRMALTLLLSVLALHSCQGQTDTVPPSTIQQTDTPGPVWTTSEINTTQDNTTPNSHQVMAVATTNPTTADTKYTGLDPTQSQHTTSQTGMTKTTEQVPTTLPAVSTDDKINPQLPQEHTQENPQTTPTLPPKHERITTSHANRLGSASQNQPTQTTQTPTGTQKSQTTQTANVFVPVLVVGLGLAAVLIVAYAYKNKSQRKAKDMKLAEASFMADEENQGNTLVSVAPLNTLESQEKTSQNGEFLEAVKTQNPPAATNGHSATKSDTEL